MKAALIALALLPLLAGLPAPAQTTQPAVEDFKPASSNQPGKQYPQVNSEGRAVPHRRAPGPGRPHQPGRGNPPDQGRGRRLGRHHRATG